MNAHFRKASLLVNQQRFEEALGELALATAEEADDPFHHGLRAIALMQLGRHQQALEAAQKTIEIAPDLDYSHYVLALVYAECGHLREAHDAIQTALQIDPADADYFGVLARIEFLREQWAAALDAAERGLQIDPASDVCRHWRSHALMKLGRAEEAAQELDILMADDPNDPYTHDAKGWMHLQQGDAVEAKRHFLEALRIDPNLANARHGLATALKARHVLFGWLLQVLLYVDRFRSWALFLVAAGVVLAMRFGDKWVEAHPDHYVWIWLAKAAVWTFAVALIAAQPLFDLVLRLDNEGRTALTPEKTSASNWNALSLLAGLGIIALWAWKGGRLLPSLAFAAISLTTAITNTFDASAGWVRRRMAWITLFAAAQIPLSYLMLLAFLIVSLKSKVAVLSLLKLALYLPAVSILISSFSDNIAEFLEKRRPDQESN
jgi:tetratricopeptide (TPR) repeat protein